MIQEIDVLKMSLKSEYEQDFHQWIERHIVLLRERRLDEIDVDHLLEELEDMGKNNFRALKSRFIVLIAHLLKWQYQYRQLKDLWIAFTGGSWRCTIGNQRIEIIELLQDNPSLKRFLSDIVADAYIDALRLAMKDTELSQATFPSECPYTIEQLLDEDFYPNSK